MQFTTFQVGKPTGSIGPDQVQFDITDSGGLLIIRMSNPTPKEQQAFKEGIKLRFAVVNNIIFVLVKFGGLNWMDAPYYRNFSINRTKEFKPLPEGQGLSVHIMLINGANGILVDQRIVVLTNKFTNALYKSINSQPTMLDYDIRLNNALARYRTNDLVKLSEPVICTFD